MTETQTKIEVERAQKLLEARGMDNWEIDPTNGYKYTEVTFINRGDGEIIVVNRAYRVAIKALEQEKQNAER